MSNRLSEHAIFDIGSPTGTDVGGGTLTTAYRSMKNFSRVIAYIELGTWNASDDLDTGRINVAQDTSGTGAGELTTDGSGLNYDTDSPIDSDGDILIIEARAEDLDVEGSDVAVQTIVGEAGDNGIDDVMCVQIVYGAAYGRKELQGTPSASLVYADPNT